mgnify:FL=1
MNMKINKVITVLLFFWFSTVNAGEILIKVINIEEKVGLIHIALYDDPTLFPEEEGKKLGLKIDVKKIINSGVIINDLKESRYALAIFHDKNSNNKFDTFFSIPKEKYGFSNDAPVFFGPPSFDDASFFLKNDQFLIMEINLR